MKNKTIGLVIGRFQPFHNAHLKIIQIALSKYDKVVCLIGSYRQARNIHNPFSFEERKDMILSSFGKEKERLIIRSIRDYLYSDNLWTSEVQRIIDEITEEQMDVTIIGHNRDASSYYLSMFPQWKFYDVGVLEKDISASDIRTEYLTNGKISSFKNLPFYVVKFLKDFERTSEYRELVEEYNFIQSYKKLWKVAPYEPTFITVDAVCIKSAHVLLVRRKCMPGKNLLAFPGGYIKANETIIQSMLRELKEETRIKLPKEQLQKSIVSQKVFDSPNRDLRGRVITHGFYLDLGIGKLPLVKGGDDAAHAIWMPLHEAFSNDDAFFSDHWHILNYFCFTNQLGFNV